MVGAHGSKAPTTTFSFAAPLPRLLPRRTWNEVLLWYRRFVITLILVCGVVSYGTAADNTACEFIFRDGFEPHPYRHTVTIDGANDFLVALESFLTTSVGYQAYVTWDATHLYLGYSGADIASRDSNKWLLAYFDVGTGPAAQAGMDYNGQAPMLPFGAKYHYRLKLALTYQGLLEYTDTGAWVTTTATPQFFQAGTFVEIAISWPDLGNPAQLGLVTFLLDESPASAWTYAGLPPNSFVDGFDPDLAHYLHTDQSSPLPPCVSTTLP
jgi:hypothetical protein